MSEPGRSPPPPEAEAPREPRPDADAVPPRPLWETLGVFALVALGTAGITWLGDLLPGLEGYVHLLVGALFLVSALKLAQREPGGMIRHGVDLAGMLTPPDPDDERPAGPLGLYDLGRAIRGALPSAARETGVALAAAALIFPPFVVGFWWWHAPRHGFEASLPADLGSFALTQLLVVALPEEAFFRGYVQTRLHDRWGPSVRLLGARLDLRAWVLSAALFAAIHFVSIFYPARLAVFFPGLL
ncbi:MAG TPA: CPBP family intramembrane glutamic endopeptidase, partial [Sandaracinaceae bacterium LLY-WYZ-13_1]|nr:CPBP family intramembrane glutamic endopeptidase [Sandaracinaceae bacterium LLY-WYZ-13_1]